MKGWLAEWPARVAPLADMLCFAGAGAGPAAFRDWATSLPAWCAVLACHLPGRERRLGEPFAESLVEAASQTAAHYLAMPRGRPVVLFGHSMGGALAVETAAELAARGHAPQALVLAASSPRDAGRAPALQDMAELLLRYDPANARLVEEPELFRALAPVLAADLAMLRCHTVLSGPRPEPVWLLAGADDPVVGAKDAAGWRRHFTGRIESRIMPGGHFFPFREAREPVLALLSSLLRQAARL